MRGTLTSTQKSESDFNIWPGFVDALTALVMVLLFVVLVFVIFQHYLSSELMGSNKAVSSLSDEMKRLSLLLDHSKQKNKNLVANHSLLQSEVEHLNTALDTAKKEQDSLQGRLEVVQRFHEEAEQKTLSLQDQMTGLQKKLEEATSQLSTRAEALDVNQSQNASLRSQVARLTNQLDTLNNSETRKKEHYQSEFFTRLRNALDHRSDVIVVGDRFMFQSEVLFDSASAELEAGGKKQLDILADSLKEIVVTLPNDLNWILRIDGHTDKRPIHTPQFNSNWELSAARAISVVNYLIEKGIPAKRLAAAGFGEFQPIDLRQDTNNRRIELRIDQR